MRAHQIHGSYREPTLRSAISMALATILLQSLEPTSPYPLLATT